MSTTKEHTQYPSRYKLGEQVLFQPSFATLKYLGTTETALELVIKCKESAVLSKIIGIHFTEAKILYDIAVCCDICETGFYEALPLRYVDSCMLLDLE